MRSIAEIDADIAEVKKRIAARNEGIPLRNSPEYRAARFDYIVDGDRSGLDAYQNALNSAIQNKLSRESSYKMEKEGKNQASIEEDDKIVQSIRDADAVIDDLKSRNYSDDSVDMRKAKNERDYWLKRAERKGLDVSLYRDSQKAPASSDTSEQSKANAAPTARTYEQIAADIDALASDSSATMDDVKRYEEELQLHKSEIPFDKYTYSMNKLNEKKKAINDSSWNEYNSRVKAALGEKDYKKRKGLLEPLKEELANYKGQEKYAEVEKLINDGLKKPAASPVVQYIKNLKPVNLMGSYAKLRIAANKSKTENAPIGGKSYPYTLVYNNDGSLTVSGGGFSRTFKASYFSEESIGNERKPDSKVNENKEGSKNSVVSVLSGGEDGKKAKRGGASRKAPVAEPED